MRRRLTALGGLLAALMLVAAIPAAVGGSSRTIIRTQVLTGLPLAYTGAKAPIRGVNGGGVPWVIDFGRAEISQGGWLEVKVKGLVIDPNDPTAISRGIAGTNPSATFRALVSCLTAGGGTQNLLSGGRGLLVPRRRTTGLDPSRARGSPVPPDPQARR